MLLGEGEGGVRGTGGGGGFDFLLKSNEGGSMGPRGWNLGGGGGYFLFVFGAEMSTLKSLLDVQCAKLEPASTASGGNGVGSQFTSTVQVGAPRSVLIAGASGLGFIVVSWQLNWLTRGQRGLHHWSSSHLPQLWV